MSEALLYQEEDYRCAQYQAFLAAIDTLVFGEALIFRWSIAIWSALTKE